MNDENPYETELLSNDPLTEHEIERGCEVAAILADDEDGEAVDVAVCELAITNCRVVPSKQGDSRPPFHMGR